MSFRFDLDKAIQATGVLLREMPHRWMTRLRLLKLLYIADRESIRETGHPITGDRVIAMEHGPVLSQVYQCIRGSAFGLDRWERHFMSEGVSVRMKRETSVDELSRYEVETLQRVSQEREGKDEWDIVEESHTTFPEWERPTTPWQVIPFETILGAVGRGEQAEQILKEAQADAAVQETIDNAEDQVARDHLMREIG